MGREVKRVPLDFDAPLNETWQGFLRPDELDLPTCPDCGGEGATSALRWVSSVVRLLLMIDEDRRSQDRGRPVHPWLAQVALKPDQRPSADIAEFGTGLAGRAAGFGGHDAINHWRATTKVIEAAGLPETWGRCPTCSGEGHVGTAEQVAAQDAWTSTQPPTGDGWQLWETVSEGSPISPVFGSAHELAMWMTRNDRTVNGPMGSLDAALKFVQAGWAPSFVGTPEHGLMTGTDWVGGGDS